MWTDGDGDRVPTQEVVSYTGSEHCDWQSMTFLETGGHTYVRASPPDLRDFFAAPYDPARPLRPWLFAILRNVVVDELRARAARAVPRLPVDEPALDGDVLERVLDGWLVEEALRRIGDQHRAVLLATVYGGRSYAEVAAELGIPEGTARSRAFYGLRALRLALEEMGWEA